jgi:hypothetical protein
VKEEVLGVINQKKIEMNKLIILLAVSITIFACNTASNNTTKEEEFIPSITYFEQGESNQVRMSLPNGGSKIIHNFDSPIFESGKKCSFTYDTPMGGIPFLQGDSLYQLVNTSYAKTSGGRFNIIYIYQKKESYIVYMETIEIEGLVDSKTLYKGNIYQAKEDELTEVVKDVSFENQKVVQSMEFISNNNSNEKIEMVINGKDVSMEIYRNGEISQVIKGKYSNNKLKLDDYLSWELNGTNLCYHEEGADYCYSKISK